MNLLANPLSDADPRRARSRPGTGNGRFPILGVFAGVVLATGVLFGQDRAGGAGDASAPGELRTYSTLHSVGVEWDITGDANHNATCAVQFRAKGTGDWKPALPLFRIAWHGWYGDLKADRAYNMLAGSIMFLDPGTTYEVRLRLADQDGGDLEKTAEVTTRAVPELPKGGRELHVVPGKGGGDGSAGNPFKGLPAAQDAALSGDVILVHAGDYGNADAKFRFDKSGAAGRHLVWKAAGDGAPVLIAGVVSASHVWLHGLVFKTDHELKLGPDGKNPDGGNGLRAQGKCENVAITRCRFEGYHYALTLNGESRAWYIADNDIVGDKLNIDISDTEGEGVELNHGNDHEVCYNRISRVSDGVSYPGRNCDIYGNDIRDVTDDGVEPDYGYANNRIWENRIHWAFNEGFSFQPMYCGPWYFVRNEVIGRKNILKGNVVDRFVLVGNTLISNGRYCERTAGVVLRAFSRNNLWILVHNWDAKESSYAIWVGGMRPREKYGIEYPATADWKTDVDYDGFDWDQTPTPFWWSMEGTPEKAFKDLESFSSAVGIEKHGVRVRRQEIFESTDVIAYARDHFPAMRLSLKQGCNAIDAGQAVPNLADRFNGKAPDLGAHEFGQPPVSYGPRLETR